MIAVAVLFGAVAFHVGAVVAGFMGPVQRAVAGLLVIAANYGIRRLLFLDPSLAGTEALWFGLILLGDMTFLTLLVFSIARPAPSFRLVWTDAVVVLFVVYSLVMVAIDGRAGTVVRFAHWKDEYFYVAAYFLARLNGTEPFRRMGALAALAVLGVAVAVWQATVGPLGVDIAWALSDRSVLSAGGRDAIIGSHGLGNLAAGWLRPFGVFGNGTDFGIYLAAIGLLAVGARLPDSEAPPLRTIARAALRPFPLLCWLGVTISVVRFNWAVVALGLCCLFLATLSGTVRRAAAAVAVAVALAVAAVAFLSAAPLVAGGDTLLSRAFVTGTYFERAEAQAAYLDRIAEAPSILLVGEGFGRFGAASTKFGGRQEEGLEPPRHHSRLLDFVQDGGLPLLGLFVAPLWMAFRVRRLPWDPLRAAALSFCAAFLGTAALLGGRSALLQVLYWSFLGLAVNRTVDLRGQGRP